MTSGQSAKRCLASNTKTQRLRERTGISTPRPRASLEAPEAPAASTKTPQATRAPPASLTPVTCAPCRSKATTSSSR